MKIRWTEAFEKRQMVNPWLLLSFFLILFGAKQILIQYAGFPQPVWDQWDAQAANLYLPYLNNELHFLSLFDSHNEHRIFTTRLLSILLLYLNNQWDPILEMVVNSLLHIGVLFLLCHLVAKLGGKKYFYSSLAFGTLIWILPFGWDNSVSGFQSQFYFLLIFSILGLYFLTTQPVFSLCWCAGYISTCFAILSMASGVLILPVAIIYVLWQTVFVSNKERPKYIASILLLLATFIAAYLCIPKIPGHEALKAHSFGAFCFSFFSALAWPFISHQWMFIVVWSPSLFLLPVFYKHSEKLTLFDFYLLSLFLWVAFQSAAFAYSRGADGVLPVSKYMDIFSIGLLLNMIATVRLIEVLEKNGVFSNATKKIIFTWILTCAAGMLLLVVKNSIPDIKEQKRFGDIQLSNMKKYVYTGDESALKDLPFREIPYPDASRLVSIASDKAIRSIFPLELSFPSVFIDQANSRGFVRRGYYPFMEGNSSEPTIGSYGESGDKTIGEFYSQFRAYNTAYIVLSIAGYLGMDGIEAYIETKDGRRYPVTSGHPPKESWVDVILPNPGGEIRVVLLDSSSRYWIATSAIKELGRLSYWSRIIIKNALYFFILGILGVLVCNGVRIVDGLKD